MINDEEKKVADDLDTYRYGFHVDEKPVFKTGKGLDEDIIKTISAKKNEPKWMTDFRLNAYEIFKSKPMPKWGADLSAINFDDIYYYLRPAEETLRDWNDVPEDIKTTFEKLGVPEAERKFLAGSGAQFESEMVYHNLHKDLQDKGVIFEGIDDALKNHPELFEQYFSRIVSPRDNKFAALNSAVWSGGSFIYVPKGVKVELPLQAYFRINSQRMGQFERTLIIADEYSDVHYIEGCTAPTYSSDSLHAAVVEIVVLKGAKVQYTTIQNWSHNVFNLVTKRAKVLEDGKMFWLDCNIGSKVTMKYPAVYLMGPRAKAEVLSVAFAGGLQVQDTGTKIIHAAEGTSAIINSKSISKGSGRSSFRALVHVSDDANNAKTKMNCDALLIDDASRSDTYPTMKIENGSAQIEHEATVSKIGEDQLFYLMSRGLSEKEASAMIINGFLEPIVRQLPMEYAIEMNRLVSLEMDNSIG